MQAVSHHGRNIYDMMGEEEDQGARSLLVPTGAGASL